MEVKCLNTGHDFSRDFPAAVTTNFYAAAADYGFGNQKLRLRTALHKTELKNISEV